MKIQVYRRAKTLTLTLMTTVALALGASCGSPPKGAPRFDSSKGKPVVEKSVGPGVSTADAEAKTTPKPPTTADDNTVPGESLNEYRINDNTGRGLQRKNLRQLVTSLSACVGSSSVDESFLVIKQEMVLAGAVTAAAIAAGTPASTAPAAMGAANAEGRLAFLGAERYGSKVGTSILTSEKDSLDSGAGRTGVAADTVEDDNFLSALGTVADVVAWNCDVNAGGACYCSTQAAAEALISRCMPLLSGARADVKAVAAKMSDASHCGSTDKYKRRQAVASLISSYAFATSK